MRADVKPAGELRHGPDLKDLTGTPLRPRELPGESDPMAILALSRRTSCPEGHRQRLEPAAFQNRLRVACAIILEVFADPLFEPAGYRLRAGVRWPPLPDSEQKIRKYAVPEHDPITRTPSRSCPGS